MFLAHSIRLRDPWQCEPTAQGGLRWTRTFHRPTGLEPDDDLWLVLSGLPEEARVQVNGHTFAAARGRDSFATEEPATHKTNQSQKRPAPFRAASPGATGVPPVPGATGVPPVPEAGTRVTSYETPPNLPASFNLTPILADKNHIEIHILSASSRLKPQASPLPTSFPYDARLAIMARS